VHANKDIAYERAFVVDEDALRRLNKIVTDQTSGLTYKVKLSDGTVLHPSDFEEILGLANISRRAIHKISGETAYQAPLRIEFSIDNSMWAKTIDFSVRGEEKDVVFASERLDEWASSVSQWYGFLCFPTGTTTSMQLGAWFGGVALLYLTSSLSHHLPALVPFTLFSAVVLILVSFSFGWVVKYVFPRGIFAIGGGVARLRTYENRQKIFSLGTIIAPIVTVLLGIVANKLSH
jgi:hypothetical protein